MHAITDKKKMGGRVRSGQLDTGMFLETSHHAQRRNVGMILRGGHVQAKIQTNSHEELYETEGGDIGLQTKEAASGKEISSSLATELHGPKGNGIPLPTAEKNFFEPRFGKDFSHTHLHTDSRANALARSVNAKAFTLGRDVVFGAGEYRPETTEGKHLLAHELAHTMQQGGVRDSGTLQRVVLGDITQQSIVPSWAHALTDQELYDQIQLLRGYIEGLAETDTERTAMTANLQVLEQEVLDRQTPTGPTGDRLLNEWLGLHGGQHLSSDRAWIRSEWPVGGSLATLNATFRAGVQALLNFVAATPGAQFHIISYARSAPKQHVMHVSQYIRKGWTGYSRYKFSGWPGVLSAGGRSHLLAQPTHLRRAQLRTIINPEVLSIVWDTGTASTSKSHGISVAEMYHIGIDNPVANGGAAYVWPTGKTTTSRHGSGNAVDADPVQFPNVITIRQDQAYTWPTLASLQAEMGTATIKELAATDTQAAGYTITGLGTITNRDAFLELFFQVRSAQRAHFTDPAHFQAP